MELGPASTRHDARFFDVFMASGSPQGPAQYPSTERRDDEREPIAHVVDLPIGVDAHVRLAIASANSSSIDMQVVDVLLVPDASGLRGEESNVSRIATLTLDRHVAIDDKDLRQLGESFSHVLDDRVDRIRSEIDRLIANKRGRHRESERARRGGLAPWQLSRACSLLERSLACNVALEDLARACGVSRSQFSRAFSRSTGMGAHRWLLRRRIDLAKDMLLADVMPLAQIASACGFADQSHLTRTFTRLGGVTPGRWSRMAKGRLAGIRSRAVRAPPSTNPSLGLQVDGTFDPPPLHRRF